jgi:hypothetical protein
MNKLNQEIKKYRTLANSGLNCQHEVERLLLVRDKLSRKTINEVMASDWGMSGNLCYEISDDIMAQAMKDLQKS